MILPQSVEYAMRAMACIAAEPDKPLRASDLAEMASIPLPYLSKVMRKLVVAGLLHSQRGRGGGFVLARPARFIRLLDVMVATGFEPNPSHCAFGWGQCDQSAPCPLHNAWSRLNESVCDWAAHTTLDALRSSQPIGGRAG